MNAAVALDNVKPIRRHENTAPEVEPKRSRFLCATDWLGFTMARTEDPRGWSFNPATVTLAILIAGLLTGGGYYVGSTDTERKDVQQRLKTAEETATNTLIQKAVDDKEKQFRQEEMANMAREVRVLREKVGDK